eukprot:3042842-Amphidinium_carterae.1
MIFGYTSGEEFGYKLVKFWFEGKNMVTSISITQENDPINGHQVNMLKAMDMEITADDSVSQIGPIV